MKRTSAYFISILLFAAFLPVKGQDTVYVPLNIRVGGEVSGPVKYFTDKKILNAEGNIAVDLNEKTSFMVAAGITNYNYSQYNYDYKTTGKFLRTGFDFNLMGPEKSKGKYYTGIGLHYGISRSTLEVPSFTTTNYWGSVTSSIPKTSGYANFLEATPGVRTELFRYFNIGWTINIRWLFRKSMSSDLNPLYLPGFGNAGKNVSTGFSYYITFSIPYKTKRVIILPPPPEDTDTEPTPVTPGNLYP
jgi:hypothetical protein